jgi:hypothetical protein
LPVPRFGRIPGRREGEPIEISRARAAMKDEIATLQEGDAAHFDRLRGKALRTIEYVLDLPNSLEDLGGDLMMQHRRVRMQLDAAQSVVADAIKIDEASLHHVEHTDKIDILMKKLRAVKMPAE